MADEKQKYQFRRRLDNIQDIVYGINAGDSAKIANFVESLRNVSVEEIFTQPVTSINIGNNLTLLSTNLKTLESGFGAIELNRFYTYLFPSDLVRALSNIAAILVEKDSRLSEYAKGELHLVKKWGNFDTGYKTIDEVEFLNHFTEAQALLQSVISAFDANRDFLKSKNKYENTLSDKDLKKLVDELAKQEEEKKKAEVEEVGEKWDASYDTHPAEFVSLFKLVADHKNVLSDPALDPREVGMADGSTTNLIQTIDQALERARAIREVYKNDPRVDALVAFRRDEAIHNIYFKPALDLQRELKKRAEEIDNKKFEDWKKAFEKNISDKSNDFKTRLTTTTSVADLENLLIEIDLYTEDLPKFGDKSVSIKKTEDEIAKAKTILGAVRQGIFEKLERVQGEAAFAAEELTIQEYQIKVKKLEELIKIILATSFKANNVRQVDKIIKDLEDEFNSLATDIKAKSLKTPPRVEAIRARIFGADSSVGEYSMALTKLKELRAQIQNSMIEIEKQIEALDKNYLASVNSTQQTIISPNVERLRNLTEHQSPEFKRLMDLYFRFRDGYNPNTTKNVGDTLMYARSTSEARFAMRLFFNTQELIAFYNLGDVTFEDSEGDPHTINVQELVKKLEEYFKTVSWEKLDDIGNVKTFTYAINGNPLRGETDVNGDPIPRIEERLAAEFPELTKMPSFVLDAFSLFIPLSEMRKQHLIVNFAAYTVSPIPGIQDFEDLDVIAPEAQHLYNVQSSTFIDRNLQPFLFSLPTVESTTPQERVGWDSTNTVVNLPTRQVGYEMEMKPNTKFILPANCKNRENIVLSRQIEEVLRTFLSPVEFGKVQLKPHLQILPSFYQIVTGEFDGKKLLYRPTLEEYNDLMTNIKAFYDFVHKEFRPLKHIDDVDTHVGEMIAKAKMMKGIFGVINTKEDELFTPYIQLLMLVYLKKLYNSYKDLVAGEIAQEGIHYFNPKRLAERGKSSLSRFVHIVSPMLRSSKTLPQHLVDTEPGTTPEAVATRLDLCGTVFDEIEEGPAIVSGGGRLSNLIKEQSRGFLDKFTYWGAFFDNTLDTNDIENIVKRLRNHEFFQAIEIYARPKNLAADPKDK